MLSFEPYFQTMYYLDVWPTCLSLLSVVVVQMSQVKLTTTAEAS